MTEAAALPSPTPPDAALPVVQATRLNERDAWELALRKAKLYSASTLVPQAYRDSIPNCLIALNMARRIGADELMVMQNLFIVNGRPGWGSQFLIATFNQCGRFTAMRFEWQGDSGSGKDRACRAHAIERDTGERITGAWIDWKMVDAEGWAKKAGSKWQTMPEQMFMYRAGAFLVRAFAPEIAMGLQTVEELRDVIDIEVEPTPSKTDAVLAALKARQAMPADEMAADTSAPAATPAA